MRRVVPLSVVSVLALVGACTGSSSPGTTSASTSTGAAVSPSATTTLATGVATPTPDPNLDATTHARLHVVALDHRGANVDVFVDGATANNGGQAQVNVPTGYVTAYLYVAPGTHRVAVVPTGTAPAQAGQAGVDVPVAAGHRYLVAFPAPITGGSAKPLVVDETDAAAHVGATPADSVYITLNGLAGTTGLDFKWAGKVINAGIKFGDFGTGIVPAGDAHITVTAKGATDTTSHRREELFTSRATRCSASSEPTQRRRAAGRWSTARRRPSRTSSTPCMPTTPRTSSPEAATPVVASRRSPPCWPPSRPPG